MKHLTPTKQLKTIEFRKTITAPVDIVNTSKISDVKDEKVIRFQTLISIMLSS